MAKVPVVKSGSPIVIPNGSGYAPAVTENPCDCCDTDCACPNQFATVDWARIILESTGDCTFRGTLVLNPPPNITITNTIWSTTDTTLPNDILQQTPTTIDLQQDAGDCDALINTIEYDEETSDPDCPVRSCTAVVWECYSCCAAWNACAKNTNKILDTDPWCVGGPTYPEAFLMELLPDSIDPRIETCFPCDIISPLILDRTANPLLYTAFVGVDGWTVPGTCEYFPLAIGSTGGFGFNVSYSISTVFGCGSRLEIETSWQQSQSPFSFYRSLGLHFGGIPSMLKENVRIFNVNTPNFITCYGDGQHGIGDVRVTPIWP